jgi:hypothetical protein
MKRGVVRQQRFDGLHRTLDAPKGRPCGALHVDTIDLDPPPVRPVPRGPIISFPLPNDNAIEIRLKKAG